MKKVYLAKSNKANPDLVSKVRQAMSKFNVQIVEFAGGTYSNDLLLSCSELIIIPDISECYDDGYYWNCSIGKGLYEQIDAFKAKKNTSGFFVITADDDEGVGGYYYDNGVNGRYSSGGELEECDISIENEDDYVKYAYISIDTEKTGHVGFEISEYMGEISDLKDESWVSNTLTESIKEHNNHVSGSKSKYKYLLLKRSRV
jgi:hypothetical protein